ncbi:MAG: peptidase, partial [Caldisericia bacterium]
MNPSRLIELFLQVIRINALSANEKPLADFIERFLSNLGYKVEYDNSTKFTHSNTGNLISKIGSGGDFVMIAHMDTARPTENVKPIIKE